MKIIKIKKKKRSDQPALDMKFYVRNKAMDLVRNKMRNSVNAVYNFSLFTECSVMDNLGEKIHGFIFLYLFTNSY